MLSVIHKQNLVVLLIKPKHSATTACIKYFFHHFKGAKSFLCGRKTPLLSLIFSLFQLTFSQHFAHFCCITDNKNLFDVSTYLFPKQSSVPCILYIPSLFPRLLYVPFAIAFSLSRRFFFLIFEPFLPKSITSKLFVYSKFQFAIL